MAKLLLSSLNLSYIGFFFFFPSRYGQSLLSSASQLRQDSLNRQQAIAARRASAEVRNGKKSYLKTLTFGRL